MSNNATAYSTPKQRLERQSLKDKDREDSQKGSLTKVSISRYFELQSSKLKSETYIFAKRYGLTEE
mgnify:FL=1